MTEKDKPYKLVHAYQFDPIIEGAERPVPVMIVVDRHLPKSNTLTLGEATALYDEDAKAIVEALHSSLPQGTFDRLGLEFMRLKVSLYRGRTDP